jgi:hypothetical protein
MSMSSTIVPRFLYHGQALAAGGHFERPFADVLAPQASLVLPSVGGYGGARAENFNFHDFVKFRSAASTVSGSESEVDGKRVFNTRVCVVVEGLNIGDVVFADRVVARLVSEHSVHGPDVPIHPLGSHFVGLRVAGVPIELRPHDALIRGRTIDEIGAECAKKQATTPLDMYGNPLKIAERGYTATSLFDVPKALPAGLLADQPWGIRVADFGTVFLGELILSRGARRLSMIRVSLGSPERGEAEFGVVGGNGTDLP